MQDGEAETGGFAEAARGVRGRRGLCRRCAYGGLGTCGIAAKGAADLLALFEKELAKVGLGACRSANGLHGALPQRADVEVAVPGMPTVVYGRVDAETARKIVNQHLGRKLLVNDHIFDKPVADLPGRKA